MPMRDRLLAAMLELHQEAARLPQDDDRLWKWHPVARRYRRLVRQWWALPAAEGVVQGIDRETYKGLFAPLRESTLWCAGPHFNKGGHLAKLQKAVQDYHTWREKERLTTWYMQLEDTLPELTRAAVHAIYRVLPELRKRDIPTQFNLWEAHGQ